MDLVRKGCFLMKPMEVIGTALGYGKIDNVTCDLCILQLTKCTYFNTSF